MYTSRIDFCDFTRIGTEIRFLYINILEAESGRRVGKLFQGTDLPLGPDIITVWVQRLQ